LRRPVESALAALVAVVNDVAGAALRDGHVQRREHQFGIDALSYRPAHHPTAPDIEHDRQVHESGPGRHEGDIGYPQPVRLVGDELAVHQIRRRAPLGLALRRHDKATTPAHAAQAVQAHEACDPLAAHPRALIDELGTHPRHAVGRIRGGVNRPNPLDHHSILHGVLRRRAIAPGVKAAHRDSQYAAHRVHGEGGLVGHHELEDGVNVFSPLAASQAVAFANISRSVCNWRTWRRSRCSSSRSALVNPSLLVEGLPRSTAACPTQFEMVCAVQSNCRANCAGVLPAATSSIICWRNAAGYGGRVLGIANSFFHKDQVSAKTGQLQKDICTPTTGIQVSMR